MPSERLCGNWRRRGAVAAGVLASGNPASDAAPPGLRVASAAFDGPVRADVVRVIDGDTFEAAARIWLGEIGGHPCPYRRHGRAGTARPLR